MNITMHRYDKYKISSLYRNCHFNKVFNRKPFIYSFLHWSKRQPYGCRKLKRASEHCASDFYLFGWLGSFRIELKNTWNIQCVWAWNDSKCITISYSLVIRLQHADIAYRMCYLLLFAPPFGCMHTMHNFSLERQVSAEECDNCQGG